VSQRPASAPTTAPAWTLAAISPSIGAEGLNCSRTNTSTNAIGRPQRGRDRRPSGTALARREKRPDGFFFVRADAHLPLAVHFDV